MDALGKSFQMSTTSKSGLYADLVVVDRDPSTADPDDLKDVETVMTVVDGKIIHER